MLIKNTIHEDILESVQRFGIMQLLTPDDGDKWVPVTDKRLLYEELLNHLLDEIQSNGFRVTTGEFDCEPLDQLCVETARCDQLDNGCTCEQCTNQIADVAGWDSVDTTVYDGTPVSPDHEFEDDCERIDDENTVEDIGEGFFESGDGTVIYAP